MSLSRMTMRRTLLLLAGIVFILFIYISWKWFDVQELAGQWGTLIRHPQWLLLMFVAYGLSFALKAYAWRLYLGANEKLSIYYYGLMYSLLVNHLLPIKAGDLVRAGFLSRTTRHSWDESFHSVAVMRLLDMLVLGAISLAGALWLGLSATWFWIIGMLFLVIAAAFSSKLALLRRLPFVHKHLERFGGTMLSVRGIGVLALILLSWVLEAGVVYGVLRMTELPANMAHMVWANSVTIAGQAFHITPGGIGTYETTLSGTLAVLGIGWNAALSAAILSHAFKFIFAYAMGLYSFLRMPIGWREMKAWMKRKPQASGESST